MTSTSLKKSEIGTSITKEQKYTHDLKKLVNILILNSLGFFYIWFFIPFYATHELNATGTQIGVIWSVQIFGYLGTSVLAGFLTDRLPKKHLISLGAFGRGVGDLLIYFGVLASSYWFIVGGALFLGLFVGFFWIPMNALISQKSLKEHRSHAFGLRSRSIGIGQTIGALLGLSFFIYFREHRPNDTWLINLALLIFALGNFISIFLFEFTVDENLKIELQEENESLLVNVIEKNEIHIHEEQLIDEISRPIGKDNLNQPKRTFYFYLGLLLVTFFFSNVNSQIARPFIQVYIMKYISDDIMSVLFGFAPAAIVSLFLSPKLGSIVDKIDLMKGLAFLTFMGSFVTFLLINTTNIWFFSLIFIMDVSISNTTDFILSNIFTRISVKNRGKILGLQSFFGNLGAAIGPLLGGMAWDNYGGRMPFIISIIVEIILIIPFILSYKGLKPYLAEQVKKEIALS